MAAPVKTACPYCGVGCGVVATPGPRGTAAIAGDPDHPANYGRLCSKGVNLGDTLDLDGRLLKPIVNGLENDWESALEIVARRFKRIIADHGPDSIAFYVSGQILTEDYYVANKLMKGFIGSANIDTNSRLCMASSVAGHIRAFGEDIVPGNYDDLDEADLIVVTGSNTAWCHPVLYQRMAANPRARIVVIDPRRTATTDAADLHLSLTSGSDGTLFNGLLAYLHRQGKTDPDFIAAHTEGFDEALAAAEDTDIPSVARACGLAEADVAKFYGWFAETPKTVTVYSQGINQSSSGTDKVNAIINCHLATGRIGKPGMGPLSLTGQPNAMGGREVGGLANQLAAHMRLDDPAHRDLVRRFWNSPKMAEKPGLKAVDLFRAIEAGQVHAVWIMATNPMVSLPEAGRMRAALGSCEFVVVSDCMSKTDTSDFAHVLLPAAAWGEKDGTVTNSERRISRQRAFLKPPGEARPDWRIVCDVAARMGFGPDFPYQTPAEIFREHAALSGFENNGARAFDISGLANLTDSEYRDLQPVQWPVAAADSRGMPRLLDDGRFFTASGKGRFVAVAPRGPVNAVNSDYPLVLNTGRARDHWHTLTRTAKSSRLCGHLPEPFIEIHPRDAEEAGLKDGGIGRITTPWGQALGRVRVTGTQRPGTVFAPMHWNYQYAAAGLVNAAVNPEIDPVSGQPESKHTPAKVEPLPVAWHALAMTRRPFAHIGADYWVRLSAGECWRYEIAGTEPPENWDRFARALLGAPVEPGDWIAFQNTAGSIYRYARFDSNRVESCLFVAPQPLSVSRAGIASFFAKPRMLAAERMKLISGDVGEAEKGEIVCACFSVPTQDVVAAAGSGRARTADDIAESLRAGTSCGTCRPEIGVLLREMLREDETGAAKRA